MRKAFQRPCLTNPIQIVRDGEEAIAYLSSEGKYANRAELFSGGLELLRIGAWSSLDVGAWCLDLLPQRGLSSWGSNLRRAWEANFAPQFGPDLGCGSAALWHPWLERRFETFQ